MIAHLPIIAVVPGPWSGTRYQVRRNGRIVAYVSWPVRGRPQCATCENGECRHIGWVRTWREIQRAG